jgi:hypothetical protein
MGGKRRKGNKSKVTGLRVDLRGISGPANPANPAGHLQMGVIL